MENPTRRDALRKISLSLGGLALGSLANAEEVVSESLQPLDYTPPQYLPLETAVTAITLGAGARGNVYGGYAAKFPNELSIVGVAEPIEFRNNKYSKKHNIEEARRFKTWEDVFKVPKFADAIIIAMPDNLHHASCLQALALGYHVLLEKPIAQTEKECREILAAAKKYNRIVAVCHVLRYAPYFVTLKKLIHNGAIGDLISIQHFEPIQHIHMSHSFVRGNWHNSRETTPIIIAKSCHDLDILRWLVGKPAKRIAAFGGLKWFKRENEPKGAADRCLDCKAEKDCPYSALKIYHDKGSWNYTLDLPEDKTKHAEVITSRLKTTNYGRCVYRMENDQCDHYVANIEFEGGVTAAFSMEAFTGYHGRRTRVMGSMGDIVGDMTTFTHTDFRTGKSTTYDVNSFQEGIYATHGHGGGDFGLARNWVHAIAKQDATVLTSTIEASIESHLMGFAAEKSRKKGTIENIKL